MFSIRRPPAEIFGAPYKVIFLLPPKKKKKKKKGRHYFFGFSYRLLAPPGAFWRPLKLFGAPWIFLYPQIFFPHHRTLIWPTYSTFLQPNNFNSKFWRPLLMAPPGDAGATGATLRHCTHTTHTNRNYTSSKYRERLSFKDKRFFNAKK